MLSEPLPSTLDVRKAAVRGACVKGALTAPELPRFRPLLADDTGRIEAVLTFSRDEESRHLIHLQADAEVSVTCQRCLEPMTQQLSCDNTLAVVWTDEQASHLPRHLDPLVVEEEVCRLWDIVEDELILALAPYSYHDTDQCKELLARFNAAQGPADEAAAAEEPNPFNILAQLKPGTEN